MVKLGAARRQGVLFHDRMAPAALNSVHAQLVGLEEDYLQAYPGADVQRVSQPSEAMAM